VRPGDTSKQVDVSTDPATILLEVCDENGVVQIWRGTSTVVGEDDSENLVESGSRERTSQELANAARMDALDAAATEREAASSAARRVSGCDLVTRSALGAELSGPEQTALIGELCTAVCNLTMLVESLLED